MIEDKDKEIAAMKDLIEANMESKEIERLKEKLANLKTKTKAADQEKIKLERKLKEAASAKKAADIKLEALEVKASSLEFDLKTAKEEAEKLRHELGQHVAGGDELSKYKELVIQARQVEQENERLVQEVEKRDELLETTTKKMLQKTIRVEALEIEAQSSSVKMNCLEIERQKNLADLVRAQQFCLKMDRRIRELECEVAKHVAASEKAAASSVALAEERAEGTEARKMPVTLKIRKDLMA